MLKRRSASLPQADKFKQVGKAVNRPKPARIKWNEQAPFDEFTLRASQSNYQPMIRLAINSKTEKHVSHDDYSSVCSSPTLVFAKTISSKRFASAPTTMGICFSSNTMKNGSSNRAVFFRNSLSAGLLLETYQKSM